MNDTIDKDDNNINNTNTPTNKSSDNTSINNSVSKANSISRNLIYKQKSLNVHRDKPILEQTKVTSGHILVKSIVAVVKVMQAYWEENQKAVKVWEKLEVLAILEFSKK